MYLQPLEITEFQQFQIKLAGILLDFDAKSCWLVFIKEKNRRGEDSKSLKIATRR